jgi:hypothetical protein
VSRGFISGLFGLIAIALVLGGCGGGSSTTSATSTKAAFVRQGDRICGKAEAEKNAALQKAFAEAAKSGSKDGRAVEEELVTTVALPPISRMTEELSRLDRPEGEEAKAGEIIAAFEKAVQEVESDPGSVLSGSGQPFSKPDEMAKKFGFTACAEI